MPLLQTRGSASVRGFGGPGAGASGPVGPVTYIEDVFSTYLYTGTGATQTITNGINLAGKGGLVWLKSRSSPNWSHCLFDTQRGVLNRILSNSADVQQTVFYSLTSFNSNGFSLDGAYNENEPGTTYVSWTFREQPKFFDVVTYTGNGTQLFPGRAINHNLGSVPGCIIIKNLSRNTDWHVEHRSLNEWNPGGYSECLALNSPSGQSPSAFGYGCLPIATSTTFNVVGNSDSLLFPVNYAGDQYVAYLFAHNAGGFGLSGTDNVISCGSFTTASTSDSPIISLGYEPQLVLVKLTNSSGEWRLFDNMRGVATGGIDALLRPNSSAAEHTVSDYITFNATGFQWSPNIDTGANTFIYIAIRRGPMKVPTSGTSVYNAIARTGTGSAATVTGVGFPSDLVVNVNRNVASRWKYFVDRLRGAQRYLASNATDQEYTETTFPNGMLEFLQDGMRLGADTTGTFNVSGDNNVNYFLRRAPGFFDVVCYNGSGTATPTTVQHNLGVAPEMIIMFGRVFSAAGSVQGQCWTSSLTGNKTLYLFSSAGLPSWGNQAPYNVTATSFVSGQFSYPESTANRFVAYLFATCPGVSKVGSYTGNGSSQTINCGFTGGARFVLIKRTDSTVTTGDWYVWDTARGIVAGNDPHLSLNSTAAEVTTNDSIDTDSTGFIVNQLAATDINVSSATYIFLAIA